MKIALFASTTYPTQVNPNGYGGVEIVVSGIAKELDSLGHEVLLFATDGSYEPPNGKLYSYGPSVPPGTESSMEMEAFLRVYAEHKKEILSSDVIHDNTFAYAPFRIRRTGRDANILHTHHGVSYDWNEPPLPFMNLIGVSKSHAERFEKETGATWKYVYNGVNIDSYPFQSEKGERFLFLSRISDCKGTLESIRYAEQTQVPIDVVGGSFGDEVAYVQAVKQACVRSKYVNFVGEVGFEEKIRYLQNAKAVLLPIPTKLSDGRVWTEPFGLVSIEANLCGTPMIVGNNGGWAETTVHGTTGFLCNTDEDYLNAIKNIDEIKPWKCRRNGERFGSKEMTRDYLALYRETLEGRVW